VNKELQRHFIGIDGDLLHTLAVSAVELLALSGAALTVSRIAHCAVPESGLTQ
jgi:hypothetical protein